MERSANARSARRITPAEAAGLVKSGDWVDYGAVLAQPDVFDRAFIRSDVISPVHVVASAKDAQAFDLTNRKGRRVTRVGDDAPE